MEWFGGSYEDHMKIPVTRRWRLLVWKKEVEDKRANLDREQAARLRSLTRRGRRR